MAAQIPAPYQQPTVVNMRAVLAVLLLVAGATVLTVAAWRVDADLGLATLGGLLLTSGVALAFDKDR